MNLLEKHGRKIALALCFATCIPVISTVYAYEAQPGWHGEGAERYYVLETTREQATGWLKLDEGTLPSAISVIILMQMERWPPANGPLTKPTGISRKTAVC